MSMRIKKDFLIYEINWLMRYKQKCQHWKLSYQPIWDSKFYTLPYI